VPRLLEAARSVHHAVLEGAPFRVTTLVQREENVLAELRRLVDHGVEYVRSGLFIAREGAEPIDPDELVEDEAYVPQGGAIGRHRISSCGERALCLRRSRPGGGGARFAPRRTRNMSGQHGVGQGRQDWSPQTPAG